jgi:hypothetical protein
MYDDEIDGAEPNAGLPLYDLIVPNVVVRSRRASAETAV